MRAALATRFPRSTLALRGEAQDFAWPTPPMPSPGERRRRLACSPARTCARGLVERLLREAARGSASATLLLTGGDAADSQA